MAQQKKKNVTNISDKKALKLGEEKLESSGLDLQDAKKLHISCLGGVETSRLHQSFKNLCSLKLEYRDHNGKPLTDWNNCPPFYRVRYLEQPTDFASITDKKQVRYVQEPNTLPVAYYPSNYTHWAELVADADQPLIITEGELKAAKATKEGFPTVGIGGVYNWRALRAGVTWLPSLDPIKWIRRNVYICFDSDYRTNPMVCSALRELAQELERRGAIVYIVSLPQLPDLDKVGLDDFLVHAGPSSVNMFADLLSGAEPLGLADVLWKYNEKYVYVEDPGLIVKQESFLKVSPSAFKEHLQSAEVYHNRELMADGSVKFKSMSAAVKWLKWPQRREASSLTYHPGKEKFCGSEFNIWPGWGVQPKKGTVKPFLDLINHLFSHSEKGAIEWFLRWCAYPIQNPGTKMFSSAVIHGIRHGTGKSLIGYTLGHIYGKNFTEISQMDLHNSFNEWAESKQFVMGDDVTGSNKRQDADFLKKMITQKELRVNKKFIPSYVVPDCINYFFTANHPDAFFLEDDDRRFFIHEVFEGPLPNEFYTEYESWLDNGGVEALFHYLMHLDLKDFNPKAPAFKTMAKERMIANVQSDLAGWVRHLAAVPDHILKVGDIKVDKDLFTSKELLEFYDTIGKTGTTANGLGRELARAGIRQVVGGKPVRTKDGSQGRYYAVRNRDKWATATGKQVADHINQWIQQGSTKKTKKY